MSDNMGPRGPSPLSQSTSGARPAEPNLPPHATPVGGNPAGGIAAPGLPPSGRADFPPPMTAHGSDAPPPSAQDAGARMMDAAGELKDQGAEAVQTLKQEGGAVLEAAQQRASTRAVHGAADQLQETSPQIAGYVHEAASSVDRLARTLRDRGPSQLLHDVQDMARQQPVAFFGAAVLAGFAIARFARASTPAHGGDGRGREMDRDMDDVLRGRPFSGGTYPSGPSAGGMSSTKPGLAPSGPAERPLGGQSMDAARGGIG
jgi:hypothetical protein